MKKNMITKLIAGFAALSLTASISAVSALAEAAPANTDSTVTFTQMSANTQNHTYTYYQLLKGDWVEDENGKIWLTNADFGDDLDKEALVNYLKDYGDYAEKVYLNRAVAKKVVPAGSTIEDVKAAVGEDKWETSEYNPANFNIDNPNVIDDVLDVFKLFQKEMPNVENADHTLPHVAGSDYTDDKDRTIGLSTGNNIIVTILKTNKKAGSGTKIELGRNDEKTITVPNGYYFIYEEDYLSEDIFKEIDEQCTHSCAALDLLVGDGKLAGEKADVLKKLYKEAAEKEKEDIKKQLEEGKYKGNHNATIMKIANGKITVTPKIGLPRAEKKIKENVKEIDEIGGELIGTYRSIINSEKDADVDHNYDGWNDAADYSIGDDVPFALFGSVCENIDDYKHYYYRFDDRLAKGFEEPKDIKIQIGTPNGSFAPEMRELVNPVDVTDKAEIKVSKNEDGSTAINIEFKDLKALGTEITKNTVVMVTYTAKLGKEAVIGSLGNTNRVYLEYSTDTNYNGEGKPEGGGSGSGGGGGDTTTDKTPDDGVVAFTYEVDINKVDGDTLEELGDAVFTLQALDGDHKGKYVLIDENGKVNGWSEEISEDNYMITDAGGDIKIIGLDDGHYEIVEVKAPKKYHALRAPITVTINASLNKNGTYFYIQDDGTPAFIDFNKGEDISEAAATVDKEKGIYALDIANNKGITLPETGGAGVYVMYAIGGLLAICGGTYFVTRKKKD